MTGACFTQVLSGDILRGITCVWTSLPNFGMWFYPIMVLGLQIGIYMKTQNATVTFATGTLISVMLVSQGFFAGVEPAMNIPVMMMVLNLGGLLAKIMFKHT